MSRFDWKRFIKAVGVGDQQATKDMTQIASSNIPDFNWYDSHRKTPRPHKNKNRGRAKVIRALANYFADVKSNEPSWFPVDRDEIYRARLKVFQHMRNGQLYAIFNDYAPRLGRYL